MICLNHLLFKIRILDPPTEACISKDSKETGPSLTGLLSGKRQQLLLPAGQDAFWNAQYMLQHYGLGQQYDIAQMQNDNQYWLSFFLQQLPTSWWVGHFARGHEAFMNCFLHDKAFRHKVSGQEVAIYKHSLFMNAIWHKNTELAVRLLPELSGEHLETMLTCIPAEKFEAFILNKGHMLNTSMLVHSPAQTWSLSFSKEFIYQTMNPLKKVNYFSYHEQGIAAAKFMPMAAEAVLDKYYQKAQEMPYFNNWEKSIYQPIKLTLSLKKLISQYKPQP